MEGLSTQKFDFTLKFSRVEKLLLETSTVQNFSKQTDESSKSSDKNFVLGKFAISESVNLDFQKFGKFESSEFTKSRSFGKFTSFGKSLED